MGILRLELRDRKGRLKQKRVEHNYITATCFTALISALNGNSLGVGPNWAFGFIASNTAPPTRTGYCIIPMNGVNYYEYAQGGGGSDTTGSGGNRPTFTFSPAYDGEVHNTSTIVYTVPSPSTIIPITIGTLIGMFLTNSDTPQDATSGFYTIIPFKSPMTGVVATDNIYFDYSFTLADGGP